MKQALTNEIISAAIAGFEAQRKHIDAQIAELRNMLNGRRVVTSTPAAGVPKAKRKASAAVRRRMAIAQKKRLAEIKGQSNAVSQAAPEPPKRRISEEGMKRIIAANKKRWALKRAEAAKASPPAAKKAAAARKKITPKKTAAA